MELLNLNLITNYRLWLNANGGIFLTDASLLANKVGALGIFHAWVIANGNSLPPAITPLEIHPYLAANPINYNYPKLVIGTIPPISYMVDQLAIPLLVNPAGNNITQPDIPFFHGNMLSLWDFSADALLTTALANYRTGIINRLALLTQVSNYLIRNSISITDIILSCQRESINANDRGLWNIELNLELVRRLCSSNHKITTLIFTNSGTNGTSGIKIFQNGIRNGEINTTNRDAFSLFLRACQISGIKAEIKLFGAGAWQTISLANLPWLNMNVRNKILFYLKLTCTNHYEKEFLIITPPSPSNQAALGLANNHNRNLFHALNPGTTVNDFRRAVWHNACVTNNHLLINTWQ